MITFHIFYIDLKQLLIQVLLINRLLQKLQIIKAQKNFRKLPKLTQIKISNFKTKQVLKLENVNMIAYNSIPLHGRQNVKGFFYSS